MVCIPDDIFRCKEWSYIVCRNMNETRDDHIKESYNTNIVFLHCKNHMYICYKSSNTASYVRDNED